MTTDNTNSPSKTSRSSIPIVCYAEDWGRLPSSTQHLMRQLSRSHRILWVDSLGLRAPSASKGDVGRILSKISKFTKGIKEVEPNIFVLTPLVIPLYKYTLVRWINRHVLRLYIKRFLRKHRISEFIQWSSCPTAAIMVGSMGELANVYYIGDEFSEFTQFDDRLVRDLENRLLVRSDLLMVVSDKLMQTKSVYNPLTFMVPHGCDFEHFSSVQQLSDNDIPEDLRRISRPIVGYYGLIRDWFDFEMLREIFTRHPEWSLVLIGPSDTDVSRVSDLKNVHLLGPKPYRDLPRYLKGFDVCLIPYRRTEITENANPLKLLEYMASGQPVVSTDLPAVRKYEEGVLIGTTVQEIESHISDVIEGKNRRIGTHIAAGYSWRARASTVETILEKHVYRAYSSDHRPVVMHLVAAMNIAGAEKVILSLLSQKHSCPYDLRVTSFLRTSDGRGAEFLKAVAEQDVLIDKVPITFGWDLRDITNLRRLIKRHNVRLLHTHGYKSDIVGATAAKFTGIPVVSTAHGFTGSDSKLNRNDRIGRFFMRYASRTIAVSEDIRQSLIESGLSPEKILLIPNAADFAYYEGEADRDFRQEWGVNDGELLIGTAGRLSSEKAQVNLIKAFAAISDDSRQNCKLVIAGDGPELENLVSAASEYNLGNHLLLPGFISDMRSFYKAIDVFCLPSLTEGSPLTLLEAAASGKPVIATRVGSIKGLIEDSVDGFLVDPGNVEQLSISLKKLISEPGIRESFGHKLNAKLRVNFDVTNWAQRVFDVYNDILG